MVFIDDVRFHVRDNLRKAKEKIAIKIAWALPKYLVMWCAIRIISYATVGKYGSTIVPELGAMDALQRWET